MRKIIFLFWTCGYITIIDAKIKTVSQTLYHLTERVDKLNSTFMSIDQKIKGILIERNEELLELQNLQSTPHNDIVINEDKINTNENLKNELNFYFGFLLPKNCKFRRNGIKWEHGGQQRME